MTLAEKIMAAHAGRDEVGPGEFLQVRVDLVMTTDATGLVSVRQFEKMGAKRVFDPKRVVFVMDHFTPCRDIATAEVIKELREFSLQHGIRWYDVGRAGICHVLIPEEGLVLPGEVVVGGDSHTCTYGALGVFATGMGSTDIAAAMATGDVWMQVPPTIRLNYHGHLRPWVMGKDLILHTIGRIGVDGANYMAMEFGGRVISKLEMDDRFSMANMAIEAGAKAGLFEVDQRALEFLSGRCDRPYTVFHADPDAAYAKVLDVEVSQLEPQVSLPHSPANTVSVGDAGHIEVDQAVIGSCTNGRIGDLRMAARVFRGHGIHPRVRCIVVPGSQRVYLQAVREGLVEEFVRAGAVVTPPTCGPCPGGHLGVLAGGERCISSTNRNFVGRMGAPTAEVYLANPAVVAASSVTGVICHPEEVVKR